jgi:hypothetical protein
VPRAERHELRAFLRALSARLGPFPDRVSRAYAQLTAETWWTTQGASTAAVEESVKRLRGRGRRPSLQALDRRLKRQGLGVEAFDKLMCRLEGLAAGERAREADLESYLRQRYSAGDGHEPVAQQEARR